MAREGRASIGVRGLRGDRSIVTPDPTACRAWVVAGAKHGRRDLAPGSLAACRPLGLGWDFARVPIDEKPVDVPLLKLHVMGRQAIGVVVELCRDPMASRPDGIGHRIFLSFTHRRLRQIAEAA